MSQRKKRDGGGDGCREETVRTTLFFQTCTGKKDYSTMKSLVLE